MLKRGRTRGLVAMCARRLTMGIGSLFLRRLYMYCGGFVVG